MLVIPLAFAVFLDLFHQRGQFTVNKILGLLLSPAGWLAYKYWSETHAQANLFQLYLKGWNNTIADPFTVFFHTLSYAFSGGRTLTFIEIFVMLLFIFTLFWMLMQKNIRPSSAIMVYAVVTMGSFLVWDCRNCSGYISIFRYVLTLYPVFIGFAQLLLKLPAPTRRIIVILNFSFMLIASFLYSCWVFVG